MRLERERDAGGRVGLERDTHGVGLKSDEG